VVIDDNNRRTRAEPAHDPWCTPLPGALHSAVLTSAVAMCRGQHLYLVHANHTLTFYLPLLKLTVAELEQDEKEVPVTRCRVPWLLPASMP
jgi:hypothetical protein